VNDSLSDVEQVRGWGRKGDVETVIRERGREGAERKEEWSGKKRVQEAT